MSSDEEGQRYNRLRPSTGPRRRSQPRSRSRSTSRRRTRSRSTARRSRSRSRSRSVARINLSADQAALEELLNKQQEFLTDLVQTHREEVDEIVATKTQQFRSKGIEKQYQFNAKVSSQLGKIKKHLKKKKYTKAYEGVKSAIKLVEEHSEDLLVADTSRYGWLTVHTLRGSNNLPSELTKKVEKIDARLDKVKGSTAAGQHGPRANKFAPRRMAGQGGVQTWRKTQGPEEAIIAYAKSTRQGTCQQCNKSGHFYRECPEFWKAVNEQRVKDFSTGDSK